MRLFPLLVALVASSAFALAKGGSLYIACKDVKLLKDAKPGSPAVSPSVLAEGDEVKWLGASDKDKAFHQVEIKGKKGFVHMGCLKPHKPTNELGASARPIDQQAAAAPPPARYAGGTKEEQDASAQLLKLEELNKSVTDAALAAKTKELHGAK